MSQTARVFRGAGSKGARSVFNGDAIDVDSAVDVRASEYEPTNKRVRIGRTTASPNRANGAILGGRCG